MKLENIKEKTIEEKVRKEAFSRAVRTGLISTLVLFLAFLLSPLLQQTLAEEDVRYVYPIIETNCEQINATAYRFHSGDTLNFTFIFTTQEGVLASFPEHYTHYNKLYKAGHLNKTCYRDGSQTHRSYCGLGIEGSGRTWNEHIQIVETAGNHTIDWNWLFLIDEDAEGYLDINFLTEVILQIEELPTEPFPTQNLLAIGVGGAGVGAAIVGAIFFVKRRNERSK